MAKTLERIAADPYIRRIMEEQEYDELEVDLLNNTITQQSVVITQQGNTILLVTAERDNAWSERDDALAKLAEYQRRFGSLN